MHDRAEVLIGGILRTAARASALHLEAIEATTALARARGDEAAALASVCGAIERYEKLGAHYHVARLRWLEAQVRHRLFVIGEANEPEPALAAMEAACGAAMQHGYVFIAEEAHAELVIVGHAFGGEQTVRYCEMVWARTHPDQPADWETLSLPERAATRYQEYRRRHEHADEFILSSREARSGASERQVADLVETKGGHALVLLMDRQEMINHGKVVSLAEKRVILPLLLHFLCYPDSAFTMAELAESVWHTRDLSSSMQTKVKVAISRLRSLLGKQREYIETSRRKLPEGGSAVAYGLAPGLEFYLVEEVEAAEER